MNEFDKKFNDRIKKIENGLIEQEHRITRIVRNIVNHGFDDSNKSKQSSAWKSLIGYFVRYQTITIFLALLSAFSASIGLYLAYHSNQIIGEQNTLIAKQNERIVQQIELQEAERKSSYMFLMSSIFEQLNQELQADENERGELSSSLIGGIAALSQGLKPYHLFEGDTLSKQKISPERGQLLLMLVRSDLSDAAYKKIYNSSDFSFADLRNFDFDYANLDGAYLFGADFSGSDLFKANLNTSNLENAIFYKTKLIETKMDSARLQNANFIEAQVPVNWLTSMAIRLEQYQNYIGGDFMGKDMNLTHVYGGLFISLKNHEIDSSYSIVYQYGQKKYQTYFLKSTHNK